MVKIVRITSEINEFIVVSTNVIKKYADLNNLINLLSLLCFVNKKTNSYSFMKSL